MKKLTVLCDLDDVLWNLITPWVAALNDLYGTSVLDSEITDWKITTFFPTLTETQVYSPLFDDELWMKVQPTKNGQYFVNCILNDGHKFKLVTSSFYQNIHVKMDRLFALYPMLSWDDVIITLDKQGVYGDVLVDDGIHNLIGGNYYKILMDKPHNHNYDAESNGIVRVKNLIEAYEAINEGCVQ